jgi:proteasome lid subunit RPN8/RPN11
MGPEDELVTTIYSAELLARQLAALCEADPDREVCGFVVCRDGGVHVVPVANVADRYHAVDPVSFPRTSRDSYLMDPREQLRVHRELEARGGEILAVWHSHLEVGAYFSAKDRADAVVDGQPTVPGADYIVLGLRGGRVTEVKVFRWNRREFVEAPVIYGQASVH